MPWEVELFISTVILYFAVFGYLMAALRARLAAKRDLELVRKALFLHSHGCKEEALQLMNEAGAQ